MAPDEELPGLSRRERQIMDFLFQRGQASVGEVMDGIPNPPGYSAVRATLRTLEQKGRVTHVEEGRAYIYKPTVRRDAARRSALLERDASTIVRDLRPRTLVELARRLRGLEARGDGRAPPRRSGETRSRNTRGTC